MMAILETYTYPRCLIRRHFLIILIYPLSTNVKEHTLHSTVIKNFFQPRENTQAVSKYSLLLVNMSHVVLDKKLNSLHITK